MRLVLQTQQLGLIPKNSIMRLVHQTQRLSLVPQRQHMCLVPQTHLGLVPKDNICVLVPQTHLGTVPQRQHMRLSPSNTTSWSSLSKTVYMRPTYPQIQHKTLVTTSTQHPSQIHQEQRLSLQSYSANSQS